MFLFQVLGVFHKLYEEIPNQQYLWKLLKNTHSYRTVKSNMALKQNLVVIGGHDGGHNEGRLQRQHGQNGLDVQQIQVGNELQLAKLHC